MQLLQNIWTDQNLINILKKGEVAVMPTDTIYGIVGQALNKETVLRIYDIKKRAPEKPCIILTGDIRELDKFSIILSEEQKNKFEELSTSEPTSIILDCLPAQAGPNDTLSYLHRGTKTLAFRLPATKELRALLLETGPLVAPSANPEGLPPARNIKEAKAYFSDSVNMYIDGGEIVGKASRIVKLNSDGSLIVLRE